MFETKAPFQWSSCKIIMIKFTHLFLKYLNKKPALSRNETSKGFRKLRFRHTYWQSVRMFQWKKKKKKKEVIFLIRQKWALTGLIRWTLATYTDKYSELCDTYYTMFCSYGVGHLSSTRNYLNAYKSGHKLDKKTGNSRQHWRPWHWEVSSQDKLNAQKLH